MDSTQWQSNWIESAQSLPDDNAVVLATITKRNPHLITHKYYDVMLVFRRDGYWWNYNGYFKMSKHIEIDWWAPILIPERRYF